MLVALGCTAAPPPQVTPAADTAARAVAPTTHRPDTSAATLIPAGYGTLRQDDVAIRLEPTGLVVKLIPLDEAVIRVLAPDSYRTLHGLFESRRETIARSAGVRGLRHGDVWYGEFTALVPDARFTPTDVTITSGGRDFRPLDVFPLTRGFGQQRLQPRENQQALYLFDDAVDASQPLTVTMANERNTDWESILRKIERERTQIRARAVAQPKP
jgi:hypothetical protein